MMSMIKIILVSYGIEEEDEVNDENEKGGDDDGEEFGV